MLGLVLIGLQVWHLSIVQHEKYVELSLKPKQKSGLDIPKRGTIRDRFGEPMAVNIPVYHASILYQPIREMRGRKAYIEKLSKALSDVLEMDPIDVEDVIHAKACIFPTTPCIVKRGISEKTYYRLRMLERKFPGLVAERGVKRSYPQGKIGGSIVGYMGAINQGKYYQIGQEIKELEEFVSLRDEGLPIPLPKGYASANDVEKRLLELKEKSYSLNAFVGKLGIESSYDGPLRGTYGKKLYEITPKGKILRELEGSKQAIPGNRLILNISKDLQAKAEELLIESEGRRDKRFEMAGKDHHLVPPPWIKGGAIVAMRPGTGEVVALATAPRFDPNDFVNMDNAKIHGWLETPRHIGAIWDGEKPLTRESPYSEEKQWLGWEEYLHYVVSPKSALWNTLHYIQTVEEGTRLLTDYAALLVLAETGEMSALVDALFDDIPSCFQTSDLKKEQIRKTLEENGEEVAALKERIRQIQKHIPYNDDKLLLLDLLTLALGDEPQAELTLAELFIKRQEALKTRKEVKAKRREQFLQEDWPLWRETHFANYLKEKRKGEGRYERPYTDYLAKAKREEFAKVWEKEKKTLLDSFTLSCRSFSELNRPLFGKYPRLRTQTEQGLAGAFYPRNGFGYGKSFAFQEAAPLGSLFKVVTGYEALSQHYAKTGELNPLTIIDEYHKEAQIMGYTLNRKPIPRRYKGGRLPRSFAQIGKTDFQVAMEQSSNIYFSLLAGDVIAHPTDLLRAAKRFSFGARSGIDIGGEVRGNLPLDLHDNTTGLYAFAIGQHTFTATPLQTVLMLSCIANDGEIYKPNLVRLQGMSEPARIVETPTTTLSHLGIDEEVLATLKESLRRVVHGSHGHANPTRIRTLFESPKLKKNYRKVMPNLMGKTSSAEFIYRPCLNRDCPPIICKDTWFGGMTDDLIVVVYLKYGDWGKEAAPLATELIAKWREIEEVADRL